MNSQSESFDVIILGAGPAGIAAGLALRQRGISRLVILDREDRTGGATRHCGHPAFGLREFGRLLTGPAYAKKLGETARAAGIDIRLRHSVVALHPGGRLTVATPDGISEMQARRVVLATGARETPRSARFLTGDRPQGVMTTGTLQAAVYLEGRTPFRRPVIVGTELVGLSAVWTCLSHGIKPVAVIEAASQGSTRWPLSLFPRLCRVPVHYGSRITDIRGGRTVEGVDIAGPDGTTTKLACDGVLLTGQFVPEASLLRGHGLAVDHGSGGPVIDDAGRCSDPAYVAAGNLLRPIETAGWCFREGTRLGHQVADDLAGGEAPSRATLTVTAGPGIRYAVPQRLSLPLRTAAPLQARVDTVVSGTLRVRAGERILWQRSVSAGPYRRLLIPLAGITIPDDTAGITVEMAPPH